MVEGNNREAIFYMLDWLDYQVENLVWAVLNDSETAPEFSAVTANNRIICFIAVALDNGLPIKYRSTEQYFRQKQFPEECYYKFKTRIEQEEPYYSGKIWTWEMIGFNE